MIAQDSGLLSHFQIQINGQTLPPHAMHDLLECTVENSVALPDFCVIRFQDSEFEWIDSPLFTEGAAVIISGRHETDSGFLPLFYGEIVAVEMDLAAHGLPTLTVRCYDRSHRLQRGRQSRAFVNVTDTDVVRKIGTELGFELHAVETRQVHDWILQNNQSHWEFLQERASRNGYRLFVRNAKELHFCPVKDEEGKILRLEWGSELLRSFRIVRSVARQVDEVVVRGWDPEQKRPIVGKSKQPKGVPRVVGGKSGGEAARKAFGSAKMMVTDRPVHSQREAEILAQSLCDEIGGAFIEAEGLCAGMPELKPSTMVDIENIGKRFSGRYAVTATTHIYTPTEGYTTLFTVSGKRPATLLATLQGSDLSRRAGIGGNIVIGIVTDNKDPKGLGRVKVKYPWLTEDHASFWARQSSQMAGKGRGMFNIPEIEDEVLIAFEQGEVSRPYILGQLWNGKDGVPGTSGNPVHGPGSEVNRRGFYSRVGHKIDLDDTGGGGIKLTTAGGVKVHCTDDGPTILCSTPGGQSIKITDAGSLIEIKDNAGDIMTMTSGTVNVNATTMMNLTAPMINISGAISVTINGMAIAVNAGAMATIASGVLTAVESANIVHIGAGAGLRAEAGGKAELQGKAGVEIDGTTVVEVHAAEIKLN